MTIIDVRYQLNKILGYDKMYSNNFKECEKLLKYLKMLVIVDIYFIKLDFYKKLESLIKQKNVIWS